MSASSRGETLELLQKSLLKCLAGGRWHISVCSAAGQLSRRLTTSTPQAHFPGMLMMDFSLKLVLLFLCIFFFPSRSLSALFSHTEHKALR